MIMIGRERGKEGRGGEGRGGKGTDGEGRGGEGRGGVGRGREGRGREGRGREGRGGEGRGEGETESTDKGYGWNEERRRQIMRGMRKTKEIECGAGLKV